MNDSSGQNTSTLALVRCGATTRVSGDKRQAAILRMASLTYPSTWYTCSDRPNMGGVTRSEHQSPLPLCGLLRANQSSKSTRDVRNTFAASEMPSDV